MSHLSRKSPVFVSIKQKMQLFKLQKNFLLFRKCLIVFYKTAKTGWFRLLFTANTKCATLILSHFDHFFVIFTPKSRRSSKVVLFTMSHSSDIMRSQQRSCGTPNPNGRQQCGPVRCTGNIGLPTLPKGGITHDKR